MAARLASECGDEPVVGAAVAARVVPDGDGMAHPPSAAAFLEANERMKERIDDRRK